MGVAESWFDLTGVWWCGLTEALGSDSVLENVVNPSLETLGSASRLTQFLKHCLNPIPLRSAIVDADSEREPHIVMPKLRDELLSRMRPQLCGWGEVLK